MYIYIYIPDIGKMVRVFANVPRDQDSIPGRIIPKTLKMVLDSSLLNTQQYKVWIKGKVEPSRERSSALPFRKGSLRVALNNRRQLYLYIYVYIYIYIYIYIYMCVCVCVCACVCECVYIYIYIYVHIMLLLAPLQVSSYLNLDLGGR